VAAARLALQARTAQHRLRVAAVAELGFLGAIMQTLLAKTVATAQ